MTPYERLMAEQWPTGKFGRDDPVERLPIPERPPERRQIRPWSPEEQAQHFADLEAFVSGWRDESKEAERKRAYNREHARETATLRRHLRLVPGKDQASRPGAAAA